MTHPCQIEKPKCIKAISVKLIKKDANQVTSFFTRKHLQHTHQAT